MVPGLTDAGGWRPIRRDSRLGYVSESPRHEESDAARQQRRSRRDLSERSVDARCGRGQHDDGMEFGRRGPYTSELGDLLGRTTEFVFS